MIFKRDLLYISRSTNLRVSVRFQHPKYDYIFETLKKHRVIKLRQLLKEPVRRGVQPEYDSSGEIVVIKTANLKNGHIDTATAQYTSRDFFEQNRKKAGVKPGDILIASTGTGSIGKVDIWNDKENALADSHISIVRVDPGKVNPHYLAHFLRSRFGYLQIEINFSGMSNQIEIYPEEIEKFEILILDKDKQKNIIQEAKEKEIKLKCLKSRLKTSRLIVDEIFSKYFKLDLERYSDLKKRRLFEENLFSLSKSAQLRSSLKFHHPKVDFILEKLKEFKTVKLKQLLKEPVRRGVQPAYDEDGEIPVIKTINISKEGYVDFTETEFVSNEFYNKTRKKAGIQQGDILITSTGEGRGKVSLYNLSEPAIADSHISIVRCKENVNAKYVAFFLLSSLGKDQLTILEHAIKGTPEIYPREVEKLIVVYPSPEVQNKIVAEIEDQLNEQRKVHKQIEKLKQKIDDLIEQAILSS